MEEDTAAAGGVIEHLDALVSGNGSLTNLNLNELATSSCSSSSKDHDLVAVTCFTEIVDDVSLYFQIIRLPKQIYAWIGCNSAKFGHLYASAATRYNNVSVTCILGGASDNTASGIARRLVLKSGLTAILACNIPKNSPMLEANAEKKLVEKLIQLGYTKPKSQTCDSQIESTWC
ncbi:hypothetical protein K2173_017814 [Erythroxylum novogranatense]|uniref:Proteasome assembly chaperone 4 n=1 Tax=Erythroxylum novogranatense TaxID=1862640 RepID=A0AAV8SMI0_9ROSI|nr:hypothetical protein K2173_017814 [Erythroxylum novogranatense]